MFVFFVVGMVDRMKIENEYERGVVGLVIFGLIDEEKDIGLEKVFKWGKKMDKIIFKESYVLFGEL